MSKFHLPKVAKTITAFATKNSPAILTGLGVAGMFVAIGTAVVATPKALKAIDAEKERQNKELREEAVENGYKNHPQVDKLKPTEVVKATWKYYLPAAITAAVSTACIIGGCSENMKRNAALATAYSLSETALKEYQHKVVETIGEKKEEAVRDAIVQDKVKANPVKSNEVIITSKGETLCYDAYAGRYFKSDIEKIRRIENELNKRMLSEHWISLNDYYFELGLKATDAGDDLGWNLNGGLIDTHFSPVLDDDGNPCLAISFHVAPRYDYQHLM